MHSKEMTICVLHENAKHRVPNNMTKICVANSKDHVMCNGRGNIEEHGEETINTK